MIYVIKGDEPYLIRKKIAEILNSNKDSEVIRFNGLDASFSIHEVINACRSINLFVSKVVVLVKDAPFLYKKASDEEFSILKEYVTNPTFETDLIFYSLEGNISEKLKTTKELIKNAQLLKLDKLKKNDFFGYAKNMINQAKLNIDKDAIDYLINNSNFDLNLLSSNIKVLSLYPEKINKEALVKLISLPDEEEPFNLINALTNKDISKSIEYVNKILKYDDNILGLISMIASQLRFLYSVYYFDSIGYSTNDIMNTLKVRNDYRIIKARETLRNISKEDILSLLSKLSDLDYKCKTNSDIDDKTKLELLIVSLI